MIRRALHPVLLILLIALAQTAAAQIPGLSKAENAASQEPVDPLGRISPRGTIVAFTRAVEREDFGLASRFLQLSDAQRKNSASFVRRAQERHRP